jgi:hypothetical protein
MSKDRALKEVLEYLDADPQAFFFPATYAGGNPKTFVNPWGFVPRKIFLVGQDGQGVFYWTATDQQQWTKEHLILRNRTSNITLKLLALP